jgi:predicted nuclease with TOPRIM domain
MILFFALMALAAICFGFSLLANRADMQKDNSEIKQTTLEIDIDPYVLPSEFADSVFSRIEAEYEKENPDPIKKLKYELADKDNRIKELSTRVYTLEKRLKIYDGVWIS